MIRNTSINNSNSLNNNNNFIMYSTNDMKTTYSNNNNESYNNNNFNKLSYCIVWSPIHPITWILPFVGHMGICTSSGIGNDFRGPYYVGNDGKLAFGPATRILRIVNVILDNDTDNDTGTTRFLSKSCTNSTTTVIHSSSSSLLQQHQSTTSTTTELFNNTTITDDSNSNSTKKGKVDVQKKQQYHEHTITQQQWDDSIIIGNTVYKNRMHNICCDNCHSHVALILNTLNIQYNSLFWTCGRTIKKNNWNMIILAYLVFVKGTFISYFSIVQQFGPFCILLFLIFYFNM